MRHSHRERNRGITAGATLLIACVLQVSVYACAPTPPTLNIASIPQATTTPLGTAALAASAPTPAGTLPSTTPRTDPTAPPAATPVATAPTPTPSPVAPGAALNSLQDRPLAELSPSAQSFLDSREGKTGVAVVVPSRGTIYTANGDQLMSMASVVKVTVMLATMDRAIAQNRPLTQRERDLIEPMITRSDNDATTALWNDIGGANAVAAFLNSIAVSGIEPNQLDQWGASRATARAVALLFAKLSFDGILNAEMRTLALDYLGKVVPDQRWGVTAGAPETTPSGATIGLKDGWYPAGYGWWVNSAGVLIPPDQRPGYTIAVLTRGQPSWQYGIDTIEGVAREVHLKLHGE